MSLDATRWAWQQQIRPTQKLVLLSLADRADEVHECHPSIARLVADTGLYRETIMEAISAMEQAGILAVDRCNGRGSRYRLIGVSGRHDQSVKADQSNSSDQSEKADWKNRPEKADQSEKADSTSLEKPTATSLEKPTVNLPSEPISEPEKKKRAFDALSHLVASGVDERVASDWLTIRKAKKLPLTLTALDGAEREAAKAGLTLNGAIRYCCEAGWAGFNAGWYSDRQAKSAAPSQTAPRFMNREEGRAVAASSRLSDFRAAVAAQQGANDERTIEAPAVAGLLG